MKILFHVIKFILSHPMSEGRRLRVLLAFIQWQIGMLILKQKVVVNWVNNSKILTGKGEKGLTGNLYCGLMEFEDMAFILHYLNETDEFFDVGANAGAYTILAASVKRCRVHSFEPVPETFQRLLDQIKINRIEDLVDARNCGLGASSDILEFTNAFDCTNKVNTDPINKDVTKVPVIALDDEYNPECNSIIKIDVEGFEKFVIDGGSKFFQNINVSTCILELNGSGKDFDVTDEEIDSMIRDYGFKSVGYDPFTRAIHETKNFNEIGNTIYVKDITFTSDRCRYSDPVVIHTADGISI